MTPHERAVARKRAEERGEPVRPPEHRRRAEQAATAYGLPVDYFARMAPGVLAVFHRKAIDLNLIPTTCEEPDDAEVLPF